MAEQVTPDEIIQEEILRAAISLYRKFGPNKVTMDDVANAMGRSRTSLYYYYKNRDEIFLAALDTIVKDVAGEIRNKVAAAESLQDKFSAFCLAKVKTTSEWKSILSAIDGMLIADEKSKHTKALDSLHKKLMHQESIILKEVLTNAAEQKLIHVITPAEQDTLAFIISSSIRGIRREVFDLDAPHDVKVAIQLLAGMIVKWLE